MFDITRHLSASPAAPGDLEVLQRFLNLHDHAPDGATLDPPADMVRSFLVERGLLARWERFTDADRETYLRLRRALRALVQTEEGEPFDRADASVLERLIVDAEVLPRLGPDRRPSLEPRAGGVVGAFGAIVAIAFEASFEGTFSHLKLCASEDCRAVFYDRSKNHSGRWCSMETCGNRAKVRAWRERQRASS